ncbi:MAG TPA: periplasmic heavy metal sensor, partial [Sphingomonas sp.]|uniref:periplasmic heavy metal sensor n=1 Tax=Sphingomonas sp. TaxID=28214 RepID=UPI002ED95150
MSRRLRILLLVSLILNVLAIGATIGAGVVWLREGRPPVARRGLQFAGDALQGDQRRAFRAHLRAARRDARPYARAARAAR